MLDTVDFNHVQHISFTQSLLTDAVSVILSELLSYEHPPNPESLFSCWKARKISNQTDCCALRSFTSSRILVLNAPCSGYTFSIMKQRTPDSRGRTGR